VQREKPGTDHDLSAVVVALARIRIEAAVCVVVAN
jgi:hypothetical protein